MPDGKRRRRRRSASDTVVKTLDELARMEPVRATSPEPPEMARLGDPGPGVFTISDREPEIEVIRERIETGAGSNVWRIGLRSRSSRLLSAMPVLETTRIDLRDAVRSVEKGIESVTESHVPAWRDIEYLPKMIPRRFEVARYVPRRHLHVAAPPMTLLSGGFEAMSQSYPWCCVGKVFVGTNPNFETSSARGTGVLVGRNLMMTASHLVPWKVPDGGFWWMSFAPGFRDGPVNGRSFVTRVRGIASGVDDNEPTGFDYVICRLSEPLGDKLGWMGSQSFGNESDYTNNRWISSGYPGWFEKGQRPTVEFDIDIDDIDNDDPGLELEITDGQAAGPGWSGGPLWGLIGNKPKVIGIKSGAEFDLYDPFREVFAGGPHLVDLIKHGQANW